MDQCYEFLDKYNSIVIFCNYRTGSTALCDILSNFIRKHGTPAFNWAEYLTTNLYLTDSYIGLQANGIQANHYLYAGGAIKIAERPIPAHILQAKMDFFNRMRKDNFIIFKIQPDDFLNGNHEIINREILADESIYKIGLTREDTDNLIISNITAGLTGIWHKIKDIEQQPLAPEKKPVPFKMIDNNVKNVIMHNTWLFYNYQTLNKIIWYDELNSLNIDELGLHNFSESIFLKNDKLHVDRCKEYFLDSEEFLSLVQQIHDDLKPIVQNVRHISYYRNKWKY
jgi:hypothetical protein